MAIGANGGQPTSIKSIFLAFIFSTKFHQENKLYSHSVNFKRPTVLRLAVLFQGQTSMLTLIVSFQLRPTAIT